MSKNILVTYASRAGSTQGVAEAIAQTLEACGFRVSLLPMQSVTDVSSYDAIVAGSAIHFDKWLPEAMQFVESHQVALSQKPFAPFLVCMAMTVQSENRRDQAIKMASGYLTPVRSLVPTMSEGLFAGMLNLSKLPLIYRIPFSLLTMLRIFKEGDYRDWDAIRAWAEHLSAELMSLDSPRYAKVS